jgi:hypothetical protein
VSLRPVTIEQFPGLDLRADPGDARGAIDALNVTIEPGRIRSRDGASLFFTAGSTLASVHTHPIAAGTQVLVAASGTPGTISAVTSNGTLIASDSTKTIFTRGLTQVAIGTPTASYSYLGNENLTTLTRWDGAAWTYPAVLPAVITNPKVVGLSPTDNRLAVAQGSTIAFSDPGAPETFGANNFVRLTPGDGEDIWAMAAFNSQLFVFKESKFFVFYGNSTDSTGSPVFNYRPVVNGQGVYNGILGAACVGPDGVYFVAKDGVYRTSGGPGVKVSAALDPFFLGQGTSSFWNGGTWDPQGRDHRLAWLDGCLYVAVATGLSTSVMFIYTPALDAWTFRDTAVRGFAVTSPSASANLRRRLVYATTGTTVLRTDPTLTADNGAAIVSRYRLPFETYGTPGEKRIRETLIEGTGTPTVQWSRDWGSLTTGSAVTLGTSPAVAVGRQRLATRGRAFSLQLGAASGAWAVNRVQPNIGEGVRGVEVTV